MNKPKSNRSTKTTIRATKARATNKTRANNARQKRRTYNAQLGRPSKQVTAS